MNTPIKKIHQEYLSSFESNGKTYDLNFLWRELQNSPILQIDVSELIWITEGQPEADKERVDRTNLSTPLLVTKEDGKEIVVDGYHRLSKAIKLKIKSLPYQRVSPELLAKSETVHGKRKQETLKPPYSDWL